MKVKWIIVIVLCLGTLAQADPNDLNKRFAAWVIGGMDIDSGDDLTARLGYKEDEIEVGMASSWYGERIGAPQIYGVYGIYWLAPIEVNNPLNVSWLAEKITASPYVGAQVSIDLEKEGAYKGVIAGLNFYKILIVEYQYTDLEEQLDAIGGDRHRVFFGLRYAF